MATVTSDWRWQARRGWRHRHVIYRPSMPPGTIRVQAVCGRMVQLWANNRPSTWPLPEVDCPRCARMCPHAFR